MLSSISFKKLKHISLKPLITKSSVKRFKLKIYSENFFYSSSLAQSNTLFSLAPIYSLKTIYLGKKSYIYHSKLFHVLSVFRHFVSKPARISICGLPSTSLQCYGQQISFCLLIFLPSQIDHCLNMVTKSFLNPCIKCACQHGVTRHCFQAFWS